MLRRGLFILLFTTPTLTAPSVVIRIQKTTSADLVLFCTPMTKGLRSPTTAMIMIHENDIETWKT